MLYRIKTFFLSITLLLTGLSSFGQTGMVRFPAIHGDRIVFTYAGDLYTVAAGGGTARRLTDHPGYEMFARFSPNGSSIAFTAAFHGNTEVYTMPAAGGAPRRITHSATLDRDDVADRMGPNNITIGWKDNATVVYRSRMHSFNAFKGRLYLTDTSGAPAGELPFSVAGWMSYAPEGGQIAYNRVMREFRTWKYYRGGMADDIWLYDPTMGTTRNLTNHPAQDIFPMWIGSKIYFLSDRDRIMNLFSYHTGTGELKKETDFKDHDIKFPSAGGEEIIFEKGGFIHVFDTRTGNVRRVDISVQNTLAWALPERTDASSNITSVSPSPGCVRILFTARGEIFDVPSKEGVTYNRSLTPGVNEREATFSPDGQLIAYFSDKGYEDELYVKPSTGGTERRLTAGNNTYPFGIKWSPDSKKILWADRRLRLCITDVSTGTTTVADSSRGGEFTDYDWTPDSKWIAYAKPEAPGLASGVWMYSVAGKKPIRVTDPTFNAYAPVFDKDGKYLLYVSDRDFNPVYGKTEWNHVYTDMARVYLVPLSASAVSPFLPKNDTIAIKKAPMTAVPADSKKADKKKPVPASPAPEKTLRIDVQGMINRTVALPTEPAEYWNINCIGDKVYYMTKSAGDKKSALKLYDLKEKKEIALGYCTDYRPAPDAKNMLITSTSGKYSVVDLPKGQVKLDEYVDVSNMKFTLDKKAEWNQIFYEAHRQFSYYFYDPNMHGVDWVAIKRKYEVLLPHVAHRADLTYLIGEMIGELNVGHAYVGGGDVGNVPKVKTGLLGAETKKDPTTGYFKITSIDAGTPWVEALQSPLALPGAAVGEYITAVDGESVVEYADIHQLLVGKAGQVTELTLLDKGAVNTRKIVVKPLADVSGLKYREWITGNIEKVNKMSEGRVGYIHIPDMLTSGLNEFARYFYPQMNKQALIIDDRGNGGGNVSQQLMERLSRQLVMYNYARGGDPYVNPYQMHLGPKLMLIDKYSASDGDLFPYRFREQGLGKLVGERTWGGVVGYRGMFKLMDGGYLVRPEFAHFDKEGKNWIIEGEGVSPDVEIHNDPVYELKGHDAQLEEGVKLILKQLEERPVKKIGVPPPFPDKSK